ncbi:hypothetical protein NE237_017954 [Protea cynaroides]|uniref:Uncharacterized protein n=1 Tax=Protea cynaroides TaxID=273540 RepID=A0A9Q0QNI8_9MAGN|nr:hypothetical protein NE237_017954 [Protea cynaroides]
MVMPYICGEISYQIFAGCGVSVVEEAVENPQRDFIANVYITGAIHVPLYSQHAMVLWCGGSGSSLYVRGTTAGLESHILPGNSSGGFTKLHQPRSYQPQSCLLRDWSEFLKSTTEIVVTSLTELEAEAGGGQQLYNTPTFASHA